MRLRHALLPFAAAALLAGCSSPSVDATASAVGGAIAKPFNAVVNNTAPLPQDTTYTYWRKVPGTNLHEPYTSDHPLTRDEQEKLGILPPPAEIKPEATPSPAPAAPAA